MLILNFNKKLLFGLLPILMLATFLRFWKLDNQSFIADEYIGVNISYGYHRSGEWRYWDFLKNEISERDYTRGKIYYWQVAQLFKFFELNEGTARGVSAFWGVFGVVLIFLISYYLTKKKSIALISALFLSISVSALTFDRKLRMYSMFAPIYLCLVWSIYQFLETKPQKLPSRIKEISKFLGVNLGYLPLMFFIFFVSLKTHLLTVNIIPTVLVYFLFMAGFTWTKKRKIVNKYSIYVLVTLLFFLAALPSDTVKSALNFFGFWVNNWSYIDKLTLDYSNQILAITVFIFGCYFLVKKHQKKGLWINLSFFVPMLLAIMTWKRSAGDQYIYFIQPLKIIILSSGVYFIAQQFGEKFFKNKARGFYLAIFYLMIALVNFSFFNSKDSFYYEVRKWNHPNYRQVYHYFLKHKKEGSVLITRKLLEFNLVDSDKSTFEVFNYGGADLTLDDIHGLQEKYDDIWLINTDREFSIKKNADKYIKENFELIETNYTNKKVMIWRWQKRLKE